MRYMISIFLLFFIATHALAYDLGNRQPTKSPRPWPANVPAADRQGGDTMDDAVPIVSVPFETTGTTTGYTDDYDEACPYTDSEAPDVVYAFTPPYTMQVDIDMLGSAYDTKIYLYDRDHVLVACNDDFYVDYVSKMEVVDVDTSLAPYALVIDGYGTEHGEYTLTITEYVPCVLEPLCSQSEEEPPLEDEYEDATNGGCNSPDLGAPFGYLFEGTFCGRGGWYLEGGSNLRDTDWFVVQLGPSGMVDITIDAELPTYLFQLTPQDCESVEVFQSVLAGPCSPETMRVEGEAYGTAWVWVGSSTFEAPDNYEDQEYDYVMEIGESWYPTVTLGSDDDYTFPAQSVSYQMVSLSISDTASDHDDVNLAEHCSGSQTPGPDLVATVYLEAGDSISGQIYPCYVASRFARADQRLEPFCLAVISDLRDPDSTCLGYGCSGEYNAYVSFDAPTESGWYYLVTDRETAEPQSSTWAWIWSSATTPPTPPVSDTCADAALIQPGTISIEADLSDATNAADPGRDGCLDVADLHYTGRDLIYQVDFTRGQALDVTMLGEGGWEEALYLVRDCESPLGNCVAAGQASGEGVRLEYTALDDETLWLVCDSWGVGPRPFSLTGSLDSATSAELPAASALTLKCAPTPFNPITTITYELPHTGRTRLRIHDLRGRLITTLVDADQSAGRYVVTWQATSRRGGTLPSGAYVVRLEAGGDVRTARVTVLK